MQISPIYEDFIGSLLDGQLRDPNAIGERAKLFSVGIHRNFYVFVFDVSENDPNQFSIAYMRDTLERMISGGRALIYDNRTCVCLSRREQGVHKGAVSLLRRP